MRATGPTPSVAKVMVAGVQVHFMLMESLLGSSRLDGGGTDPHGLLVIQTLFHGGSGLLSSGATRSFLDIQR